MPLTRNNSSAIYWEQTGLNDQDVFDEASSTELKKAANINNSLAAEPDRVTEPQRTNIAKDASCRTAAAGHDASLQSATSNQQEVNNKEQAGRNHRRLDTEAEAEGSSFIQPELNQKFYSERDEEEYTFNPDAELEDAQADQHGYENAQFYEKISFGEFGKYMQNKRRKLGVQQGAFKLNAKEGETSTLLKGLRIHINGETEPPAHVISHLVVLHGGVYVPYLDAKKTSATHIIASNLTPTKRVMFKAYKVVRSEWLMESIRDQKIKDWRLYREDQTPVNIEDIGIAPSGTQIVQPRLAFNTKSTSAKTEGLDTAHEPEKRAVLPTETKSPRRLPPPTSDPLTLLHVEARDAVSHSEVDAATTAPLPGMYQTKSNSRSAALLKDEAWRLQETAVNTGEFLDKYYKESRLHWLSTWKAELKKMVGELSESRNTDLAASKRKGPLKGTEIDGRVVMHVDFDSFFVSASLLSRPHLKGQPVVVCHANGGDANSSSEIASASYEAREYGIRNGMHLGGARTRCPHLQTVPYDFELYRSTSAKFYSILFSKAHELEAVSIDEAYISLPDTSPPRNQEQLLKVAEDIRSEIRTATGLETSVGVSHNKLLARLATNRAKPASSFQIGNGTGTTGAEIREFLKDIDIETLPGIGWKRANDIEEKLANLQKRLSTGHFSKTAENDKALTAADGEQSFDKVGQLLSFTRNQLKQAMGEKTGDMLFNYARGVDPRELEMEGVRKSVSAEVNYGIRFKNQDEVDIFLGHNGLAGELARRLKALNYRGRQLTLKVMRRAADAPLEPPKFLGHGVCDVFNVSKTMDLTDDAAYLGSAACELMSSLACPPDELRGIGLQMQKLENAATTIGHSAQAGQGRLRFDIVTRGTLADSRVVEKAVEETEPVEAARPIVIIDKTSSPQATALDKSDDRPTRARPLINYVDLSSEDDGEVDLKVLSQRPANFIAKPATARQQSIIGGAIVKRGKSSSIQPKTMPVELPSTSPMVIEAPSLLPSPGKLGAKQLALLGIDASFFQSCSRSTQSELLRECLLLMGEKDEVQRLLQDLGLNTSKGSRKAAAKSSFAPVFEQAAADVAKREEKRRKEEEKAKRKNRKQALLVLNKSSYGMLPTFAAKSELKDLRRVLQQWMDGVGLDAAPALEEVDDFTKFCLDTISDKVSRNGGQGPDAAKINSLLEWWDYLIRNRNAVAKDVGSQRVAAEAWRETHTQVRDKVSRALEESWGAGLAPGDR